MLLLLWRAAAYDLDNHTATYTATSTSTSRRAKHEVVDKSCSGIDISPIKTKCSTASIGK